MQEDDPDDLDLNRSPSGPEDEPGWSPEDELSRPRGSRPGPWIAGAIGLLVLGAVAWWLVRRNPAPPVAAPTTAPSASMAPPSGTPAPLTLPPLDGSDATVREAARLLSSHPLFALWLGRTDLIRTCTAVVVNVAEGVSPRPHLAFLAPKSAFPVLERRPGRLTIDPGGYARYDAVAAALSSLDPAETARVYRLLEPLFESAYRELGHPEGGFSRKLKEAFERLLAVPVVEGEVPLVRVEKAVVVYELSDEKLEALSPPQKHLLRMGPRNVKRIQDETRALSAALGWALAPSSASPTGRP